MVGIERSEQTCFLQRAIDGHSDREKKLFQKAMRKMVSKRMCLVLNCCVSFAFFL